MQQLTTPEEREKQETEGDTSTPGRGTPAMERDSVVHLGATEFSFHPEASGAATPLPAQEFHPFSFCKGAEDHSTGPSGLGRVSGEDKKASSPSERVTFVGIMTWLNDRLDKYMVDHCRTQPTGKVFPLPSSFPVLAKVFPTVCQGVLVMLRVLVFCLNSLNGEGLDSIRECSPVH